MNDALTNPVAHKKSFEWIHPNKVYVRIYEPECVFNWERKRETISTNFSNVYFLFCSSI